jgi:L,D-transpeptidase ErfK/SrfK
MDIARSGCRFCRDPRRQSHGRSVVAGRRKPDRIAVPDVPHRGIVINLAELRLYYFPPAGGPTITFPVGIGDEGKATPVGHSQIVRKTKNPVWIPTMSERLENPDLPPIVPTGPENPMGTYAALPWLGWLRHPRDQQSPATNFIYSLQLKGLY